MIIKRVKIQTSQTPRTFQCNFCLIFIKSRQICWAPYTKRTNTLKNETKIFNSNKYVKTLVEYSKFKVFIFQDQKYYFKAFTSDVWKWNITHGNTIWKVPFTFSHHPLCTASGYKYGLGVVLSQLHPEEKKVIADTYQFIFY